MPLSDIDTRYMHYALTLARRQLGMVAPNPAVGCVIVKDNKIVSRGWTAPGGRPHAETEALALAGKEAKGATAYISLEPCAHQGKTGPCAQALIKAGVTRAVIACEDPDPRVTGKGIAMLKKAGIEVAVGVGETEARAINAGFFMRVTQGRPLVSLKLATSLDARIALASGESRWITGKEARQYGHMLRASHDAVLSGIGTVLADDPMLTCRIAGREFQSPVRVVLDGGLHLPMDSKLVKSAHTVPLWVITRPETLSLRGDYASALEAAGVRVFTVTAGENGLDLAEVLALLAQEGITRLLVEAGTRLASSFLIEGRVDAFYWFRAPIIIGTGGKEAITTPAAKAMAKLTRLKRERMIELGEDVLEVYSPQHLTAERTEQDAEI